jgi:hypothetical protein
MTDDYDRLTVAWADTQARLPEGWAIDGLRCASTGLAEEARSDDWVAMAAGPAGEERTCRATDAVEALEGLARSFESDR